MNDNMNRKNSEEFKRPDFLFRAVTVFLVAVLVIITIFLIDAANERKKEAELLREERKKLENEVEELMARNENLEAIEEMLKENNNQPSENNEQGILSDNNPENDKNAENSAEKQAEIDEAMREAAKELGYYDGDAQQYVFPVPNSGKSGSN